MTDKEIYVLYGIVVKDAPSDSIITTFVDKDEADNWVKDCNGLKVVTICLPTGTSTVVI